MCIEKNEVPLKRRCRRRDTAVKTEYSPNITDINIDCLEFIFMQLNIEDLLNFADSSSQFIDTAVFVYYVKHRKKFIAIKDLHKAEVQTIKVDEHCIKIDDMKSALQLLRCFGHLISEMKIEVMFPESDLESEIFDVKSYEIFLTYVEKYCSASLQSLSINQVPVDILKLIRTPFLKMTNITISNCNSQKRLNGNWIHRVFPNIKSLKYTNGFDRTTDFTKSCFTNLEFMDISYDSFCCKRFFESKPTYNKQHIEQIKHILKILQSNPRLIDISLPYIFDYNVLRKISECQPELQSIQFQYERDDDLDHRVSRVCFKNVKQVRMSICKPIDRSHSEMNDPIVASDMPEIPLLFEKLEFLTFYSCFRFGHGFFEFINRHRTIERIYIASCGPAKVNLNINKWKLIQAMPMIKQLIFMSHHLLLTDVLEFIRTLPLLEVFCFKLCIFDDLTDVIKRLKSEWMITVSLQPSCLVLKRKSCQSTQYSPFQHSTFNL